MSRAPRQAIGGLGMSNPAPVQPSVMREIMSSVVAGPNGPAMNPAILQNAPPWAVAILHMQQTLTFDLAVLKLALQRRSVLTEPEIMEATMLVTQQLDGALKGMAAGVEREINQRINQPPQDPRRSPR